MVDGVGGWIRRRASEPGALDVVRLAWQVAPWRSVLVGGLVAANAAAAPVTAVAVGQLVAQASAPGGGWSARASGALAAVAALTALQVVLPPILSIATATLARRTDVASSDRLLRAVLAPVGVAHLDDPDLRDQLAHARGQAGTLPPGSGVEAVGTVAGSRLGGILAAGVVAAVDWRVALLLVVVQLATLRFWRALYRRLTSWAVERTPDLRRGDWFRDTAMGFAAGKEIRVFGLGDWFADRFHAHWSDGMTKVWAAWRQRRWAVLLAVAAPAAATFAALVVIASGVRRGQTSVGTALAGAQAALLVGQLGGAADAERVVAASARGVRAARPVEDLLSAGPDGATAPATAGATTTSGRPSAPLSPAGVRFDGVGFRYPGSDGWVIRHLNLDLRPHESLALVGANGAGKTTLVKLLAGLLSPMEGSITVDGTPLDRLDLSHWRRQLAIILQDFVHYDLSAADNVHLTLSSRDGESLERAAARAGATEVVAALPAGWETPLSPRRTGGVGLSGGQWQRIALARAFMALEHGAWLLVLDEPTAALDVRAEVALYDRFLEISGGVTTLIISHRFSTVRHADRIVVLDDGRLVEDGTHEDLLAEGGRYAAMFEAQAARFGTA